MSAARPLATVGLGSALAARRTAPKKFALPPAARTGVAAGEGRGLALGVAHEIAQRSAEAGGV